jgi:8-oxo-dGTP pyrophosphatase MutT (NUDIX family)
MTKNQITIVAAVIINEEGEILLAKRNQPETPEIHGKWEFAGGGVNFGEKPEAAVKRETLEEIGLEVEVVRLLPTIISDIQKFNNGDSVQVLVLTYECKIISGVPKVSDPEIAEVKFFRVEEISKLDAFQNIYETIKFLQKESNH